MPIDLQEANGAAVGRADGSRDGSENGTMRIHPSAVIEPSAELAEDVVVGPFCVIGARVRIGAGTQLAAHVCIDGDTTIGEQCRIMQGVVLGTPPQDTKFQGERSYVEIGDRNILREYVTIHRATGEGNVTRLGSDNMLMAYSHIGHNCRIGNRVTMANQVAISGHCVIEDRVVLGGMLGIHQFVRIGRMAMVGGFSKVVTDVPPFMMADGRPAQVMGLNVLGLRRAEVPPPVRAGLKVAYRLLYRSGMNLTQGIAASFNDVDPSDERDYLLDFLTNIRNGNAGRQNEPRRSG